jgi:hypothetical protein
MAGQDQRRYHEKRGIVGQDLNDAVMQLRLLALNAVFEGAKRGLQGTDFIRAADEADALVKHMEEVQRGRDRSP